MASRLTSHIRFIFDIRSAGRTVGVIGFIGALGFLGACDFGTLDDLSQDEAVAGGDELTVQARALWKVYDTGTDDEVKAAARDLGGVVERAGARPRQLTLEGLTKDLGVPSVPLDPASAQGMLVITELDCSLAEIEKILVAKNQTTIYPDLYDKYERTYEASVQDFVSGAAPRVTWRTDYTASALGRTYEATIQGSARRVPGASPTGGTLLLSHSYLAAPARFIAGGDAEFNQDYQLEAYYEVGPKKVIHFYPLWREFRVASLTSSTSLYINVVLGNLVDFDVRTSIVCKNGSPQAAFE